MNDLTGSRPPDTHPIPRVASLRPGYDISRIIVGGWQWSEGHHRASPSREETFELLFRAVEMGVHTFDCADIYTGVETLLGEFLAAYRARMGKTAADKIQIHTKFVPDLDVLPAISRQYTQGIIDRSLRRLGVERLDLVQYYWWDHAIAGFTETAMWLQELQQAGKIRLLGVTNVDRPGTEALRHAGCDIVADQVQYSVLDQRPEHALTAYAEQHDLSLLCYGTLAGGFLTEKWIDAAPPTGSGPNRSLTKYGLIIEEVGGWVAFQNLLRTLHRIATKHQVSLATVASRWVLDRPSVAAVIVGMRTVHHVRDALNIFSVDVDDEDRAWIEQSIAVGARIPGDVFSLERDTKGPHGAIMRYNLNREAADGEGR